MHVFLLQHVHNFPDGHESVKLIGVYSNEGAALHAQQLVENAPGFREAKEGFQICECQVDPETPDWPEGYLTYDTILVPVLASGVQGLRPMQAWDVGSGVFEIGDGHALPEGEVLQFGEGSKVKCRPHRLADGTLMPLAYETVG